MTIDDLPRYTDLMVPTLRVLEGAGGSGSLHEINDGAAQLTDLPDAALEIQYESGAGAVVADRLSWARSYLKKAGYLTSGGRGIWLITEAGRAATKQPDDMLIASVAKAVRIADREKRIERNLNRGEADQEHDEGKRDWRDALLGVMQAMDPGAFERLCQRLLRESGFVKVEVTGRTSDGGIDGTGILQLSLMSFHVLFQCKRYKGSVGSGAVRDFRGAMMGRTDKGLIITTGTFTPAARREATRDGAPPIDLIEGEELCEKLKVLKLGVKTELVEEVTIEPQWFDELG